MPAATKANETTKAVGKHSKTKTHSIPQVIQKESVTSDEESSDNEGIDQEGLDRLMKALEDDDLDDFERTQLHFLSRGDDSSEGEDEDEDEDGVSEGGDGEENEDVEGDDENEVSDDPVNEEEGSASDRESKSEGEGSDEDENEDEDEDEDEDVEEVPLDEAESVDADAVPRQKIEVDDAVALERIRQTIQLDPSFPWTEMLTLSYPQKIEVDVNDDLNRELAFYKQALHGANAARALAAKHKFPFTRPSDYFAEMVKSDSHMERIRQRLLDESAGIKKSENKRKEREDKKFGKQVQIEKLKERERSKKEMEERLKGLKRKRKDILDNAQGGDDFDVAVEDAIADRPAKRGRGGARGRGLSRQSRDQKYGFGGAGRRSKQNTKESTDDFDSRAGGRRGGGGSRGGGRGGGRGGFSGRGKSRGGGAKRLGKSRRMASRSKN